MCLCRANEFTAKYSAKNDSFLSLSAKYEVLSSVVIILRGY